MSQPHPKLPPISADTLREWLRAELASGEVLATQVQLARELVALQTELDELGQGLLCRLIVALLLAMEAGGTRLDLALPDRRLVLGTSWKTQGYDGAEVDLLLEALDALATPTGADALVGSAAQHRPLVRDGSYLYLHRVYWREVGLAEALAKLAHVECPLAPAIDIEVAFDEVLASPTVGGNGQGRRRRRNTGLSTEQQYAMLAVAHSPLCIVSGGPGTGKTSLLLSVLRLALMLGVAPSRVALAAPTGKAAKRMGGALAAQRESGAVPPLERQLLRKVPAPRTLHRLLAYSEGAGFGHDAVHPMPCDLVVVDEASMLDLGLAAHLLRAMAPGTRLLLLGDADQLPPVGHGAVFRDLLPREVRYDAPFASLVQGDLPQPDFGSPSESLIGPRAVRLTESYRMRSDDPHGRSILGVSLRVKDGDVRVLTESTPAHMVVCRRPNAGAVTFEGVELLPVEGPESSGVSHLDAALSRWTASFVEPVHRDLLHTHFTLRPGSGGFLEREASLLREVLQRQEQNKILCATRSGPRGTGALNARVRTLLSARLGVYELPPLGPGTPVMVRRNDYRRGLFNGDTGVVASVRLEGEAESQPMAVFHREEDGLAVFDVQALSTLIEPAYALTVHKSQGSEYERVLFALPARDLPVLSRELLYTGLTRSRTGVLIVGEEHVMGAGILRSQQRPTGLARRLDRALADLTSPDEGGDDAGLAPPPLET